MLYSPRLWGPPSCPQPGNYAPVLCPSTTKTPLALQRTKTEAVTILAPIRTRMGYLEIKSLELVWWQHEAMSRCTQTLKTALWRSNNWLMKSFQRLIKCWRPTLLKSTCKIRKDAGLIGPSSALKTLKPPVTWLAFSLSEDISFWLSRSRSQYLLDTHEHMFVSGPISWFISDKSLPWEGN